MSYLTDDIVWIVANNSPFSDRSPYHGIAEVRSGIFDRLTAGFDKLVFDAGENFECSGGERVLSLGYYFFRFDGQAWGRKPQVFLLWLLLGRRGLTVCHFI